MNEYQTHNIGRPEGSTTSRIAEQSNLPSGSPDPSRELNQDFFSPCLRSVLSSASSAVSDIVLGKKIAHGMFLTFESGRAKVHIMKTPIQPIMASLKNYAGKIAESIQKYQLVEGITPSKSGLRVFSMVLKKLTDTPDARTAIREMTDAALTIDLNNPADRKWSCALNATIYGLPVSIALSLKKRPTFERILSSLSNEPDLNSAERINRYGYQVKIAPEAPGNQFLATLACRARQIVWISCLSSAPTAAMIGGILTGAPSSVTHAGVVAAAIVGYALHRRLSRNRLLSEN